jgi:hypothetical protein
MNAAWTCCARGVVWWIRRNPMYLVSAACMAVGARLYLVDPNAYAGDIGVILITLGVLQAYEWAVTGILLLLHRAHRAPEDEHSLLLVAALFWTGPIAATIEMTARQPRLGILLAIGVVLFAVIEFAVVRRSLRLRLSGSGAILSGACLVLLAVAPTQLRVAGPEGTNELFLYFCWWLLGGFALLVVACVRAHFPAQVGSPPSMEPVGRELAFLVIVLAATATHLVGMNYAFLGHARWFYAGPLLIALSLVGFEFAARGRRWVGLVRLVSAALPLAVLALATEPFDPEIPVRNLPAGLRDPLLTMLVLAATAWWLGAARTRSPGLFHLGSGGAALAAIRAFMILRPAVSVPPADTTEGIPLRDLVALALSAVTAYLLATAALRRSRPEAVLALFVLQAVVATLVWQRVYADRFIVGVVAGWSLFAGIHLSARRPSLAALLVPAAILTLIACYYDRDAVLCWPARLNTLALLAVLLLAALVSKRRCYRTVGFAQAAASALFLGGRSIAAGERPAATLAVLAAFALLAGGAAISWYKRALLDSAHVDGSLAPVNATAGSVPENAADT